MPGLTTQTKGQGFQDRIQAQLSSTSKYATIEYKGQKNHAVRIDQIVYGASKIPPYTDIFAGGRLFIVEGTRATCEASANVIITGLDAFVVNIPAFNPNKVYADILLTQPFINLVFDGGLVCDFDKDIVVLLMAAYNASDTVGSLPTIMTTLNVFGHYVSRGSGSKGKIVLGP